VFPHNKWSWAPATKRSFVTRFWGGEAVVYAIGTGDTCLLEPLSTELLRRLESGPKTSDELAAELAADFDFAPEDDVPALTATTLAKLRELGMVDVVPVESLESKPA
jgi:PqqD family protein of HPr-rel-A system